MADDNIHTALAKAQAKFAPAKKTSTNPHFRSRYADLQACIEAVGPALNAEGIAYSWCSENTEHGWIISAVLTHGSSNTRIACQWPVIVTKNDAQGFASGSTYARRYSLMAVCGLAPEDDDGNAASTGSDHKAPQQPDVARSKAAALLNPTKAAIADHDKTWIIKAVLGADHDVRLELAKLLTEDERAYLATIKESTTTAKPPY